VLPQKIAEPDMPNAAKSQFQICRNTAIHLRHAIGKHHVVFEVPVR